MSLLPGRTYLILPKDSSLDGDALGIGPIPLIFPPPDVPVRLVSGPSRERWLLQPGEVANTYTVFAGRGQPNDYKWIARDEAEGQKKVLYVTSVSPPGSFRFEPAGGNLYIIGIPSKDLLLTANRDASPQLTFKPADGSDAQRFQIFAIERN